MKYLVLAAVALTISGCMETQSVETIPLDDPRRARADARYAGTVQGASGITGIAIIGGWEKADAAQVNFDSRYATPAEVAAAPAKICAYLNGTVASVENQGDPSGNNDLIPEFIRYMTVTCNV